jgi:RmlD substrate binding domain
VTGEAGQLAQSLAERGPLAHLGSDGLVRHGDPISTAQYPTPAARPANSRLDVGKLARVYGVVLPEWRGAAQNCVARLLGEPATESQRP